MNRIILLLLLSITVLTGCRTIPPLQVPVQTIERKVTTLVPYRLPGDSVLMQAKFECDSTNNVLLKQLTESKSGMNTGYEFSNGTLEYSAHKQLDTIWLPSDSIIIERDIPVMVEVPVIEYRQTKWQIFRTTVGDIALAALALFGIWKVIKKYLKIF